MKPLPDFLGDSDKDRHGCGKTISSPPMPCVVCGEVGWWRTCEVCHGVSCDKHYGTARCCRRSAALRALTRKP